MNENQISYRIIGAALHIHKSVENLLPVHHAQLLTYLRLSGLKLGLLINFNNSKLNEGIHRVVNNL